MPQDLLKQSPFDRAGTIEIHPVPCRWSQVRKIAVKVILAQARGRYPQLPLESIRKPAFTCATAAHYRNEERLTFLPSQACGRTEHPLRITTKRLGASDRGQLVMTGTLVPFTGCAGCVKSHRMKTEIHSVQAAQPVSHRGPRSWALFPTFVYNPGASRAAHARHGSSTGLEQARPNGPTKTLVGRRSHAPFSRQKREYLRALREAELVAWTSHPAIAASE